ncbi:hypothetical protein [Streptomyces sp. NPDC059743]|uniref:hypothetical protein n=1 Tax=Streptomyces sp. NPDC059743 TaxID=3346928 RepID=UPI003660F2D6
MSHARTMLIATAAATAALLLTGCADQPVKHGEVISKHEHPEGWVPVYKDIYRETNCRTITTSAFTMSLSRTTSGTSGGKSLTSGGRSGTSSTSSGSTGKAPTSGGSTGGKSLTSGGSTGGANPGTSGTTSGGSHSSTRCDKKLVGRKKTGQRWQSGKWELKLRDGDRTGWIEVTHTKYLTVDLHDHI